MKNILIIAAMLCSVSAFAQQQSSTNTSSTQSVAAASNQGNAQSITFTAPAATTVTSSGTLSQTLSQTVSGATTSNVNYSGSQTVRNTPSVNGPSLVSSNDTCMGSASGSANVPGFGLSVGKTYTDTNCVMLKNSRELWNMGMKCAALELMCTDSANKEALELTGFECPQTTKAKKDAEAK